MLETIMDRQVLLVLTGAAAALGVVSKIVVSISLRRLTRAAEAMGKSNHPLMRLVRAKYEHACMVSDRVQNAEAFVERYLHEYRRLGVSLHGWRRLERTTAVSCAAFGCLAAAAEYWLRGMNDQVLRYGAAGAAAGLLLFLLRVFGDESYRLQVIRTYMVDYLDNVCARRYEKSRVKAESERAAVSREEPELPFFEEDASQLTAAPETAEAAFEESRSGVRADMQEAAAGFREAGSETGKAAASEAGREARAANLSDTGAGIRSEAGQKAGAEAVPASGTEFRPTVGAEAGRKSGMLSGAETKAAERGKQAGERARTEPVVAASAPVRPAVPASESRRKKTGQKKEQETDSQEVLIRQILEEFLA